MLELTALPSLDLDSCESGLERLLPELTDTVWVGISGGSIALTPRVGDAFLRWRSWTATCASSQRGTGFALPEES